MDYYSMQNVLKNGSDFDFGKTVDYLAILTLENKFQNNDLH